MRFLELRLEKFGHFAGRTLDLSAGSRGLHVIHGANEAGKSTALRAILALLYGFPKQTPDDFRFAYKDLRVGARVEAADGRVHDLVRLKRDKDSLLGADGRPVGEGVMASLLMGIDKSVFERVFGLDQERLREGGKELQKGGGVLAESLFAAGMGLGEIRRLRKALDEEAEALFAPRATTKKINELAADAERLRSDADASALKAEDHEARERRFADAREIAARITVEIAALDEAIARIERRIRVRPKLADLDATERELAELADVPDLPESFAKELGEALAAKRHFEATVRKSGDAIEEIRHRRDEVHVEARLLERADAIRELHGRLEAYRRALADLPKVEGQHREGADAAEAILRDLDPALTRGAASALLLPIAERKRIEDLDAVHQTGAARLEGLETQLRTARAQLDTAQAQRAALPESKDASSLARVMERVVARGDIEQAASDAERATADARADFERALASFSLWNGGADAIETAVVPGRETLARFATEYDAIETERRAIDADVARLDGDARRRGDERRELAREREVPTEAALHAARARRDQGWQLVRGAWLRGESDPETWAAYDGEREPAEAFEHAVRGADDAADGLRLDAHRVARAKALDAEDERDAARRDDCAKRQAMLAERRAAFDADWAEVWKSLDIAPRTPVEMREWLEDFARLRDLARAVRAADAAFARASSAVADAQAAMRDALGDRGEKTKPRDTLAALIDRARGVVEAANRAVRAREVLDETIRAKEDEVAQLGARHDAALADAARWAEEWREAVERLPVSPGAQPSAATAVLRRLDEFFGKEREIRIHEGRIADMRAEIDNMRAAALELCVATGIPHAGADAADLALRLNRALDEASRSEQTRNDLTQREHRESVELDDARRGLTRALDEVERLRLRAGCERDEDLETVADRAGVRRARIKRRDELRLDLARDTVDGDVDRLRAEALGTTGAADEIEWRRATDERERLREALAETNREIGMANAGLRDTAHASKTGELLERRERVLADIVDHVARYRRLRLASHLLRARIESLRERAQNPTMARAGEIFATLTRGSFTRLVGDYGSDSPRMLGVRANGDRVDVDGMSDGTRDQLWLALRLAWIELRAADGLALPVIADDLLVQFDEARATAALGALANLSDRTQVLLFTHHRHTSELIRSLDDDARARVFEHELGA